MPNVTLKNIPDDLYAQLKLRAKANRRSINNEIIVCIEKGVQDTDNNPEYYLERARKIRLKSAGYVINDEMFNQAKGANRL